MSKTDPGERRAGTRRVRIGRRVAVVMLVGGALAAGAVNRFLAPPASPPAYLDRKPVPASDGYTSHTASVLIDRPPELVKRWADRAELGDLVRADDPSMSITHTTAVRGDWNPATDRTGDRRRVRFADGHFLAEEVLRDSPARFRYQIWGFTSYQRLAVRYAVAEFDYAAVPAGTKLTWTYSFMPTGWLTRPLVADFVADTIATMMRGTLDAMKAGVERDPVR